VILSDIYFQELSAHGEKFFARPKNDVEASDVG
jgi:hypothetical protein